MWPRLCLLLASLLYNGLVSCLRLDRVLFTVGFDPLQFAWVLFTVAEGHVYCWPGPCLRVDSPHLRVAWVLFTVGRGPVHFSVRSSPNGVGIVYGWLGSCLRLARVRFHFGFAPLQLAWVLFTCG